ncbi:Site-specific recombinase XerD [Modestobacter sp. DSM 44400]|uniref:tyrosine-type recombinase/integrase n=1 Tax=Modestobacter sp. DSM 44400 TaxID=1550230 RepID=UPI0008941F03|nr:site-specific integrase [Modestobacter sp. DSM 44400]SDY21623.1 Site-specific recombinase XerD [Modestobacter sp. DSM 44400]
MASIERRTRNGQLRWYARYRDPAGAQLVKVFSRKVDAERFLTTVEASKLTGSYVDAKRASITFRAFAEEHWATYAHNLAADTTRVVKRSRLERHILPALGTYPVGALRPSAVAAAVATWSQTLAPGTVGQVLRQVRQVLDAALADGLVASNAAKAVKAPPAPRRRDVHLTDEDVTAILGATPEHYRPLVITLVGLGLRISEACGLRVQDVDFLRRSVHIRQQRRPGGDMGKLKTGSSSRDIPADDTLLEALAEQIRQWPRSDGLVFSSTLGRPLTKSIAGHVFDDIERAVGFTVSPHSLRHYFGAGLVSRGVSVVAVARWLGHSSPEITYRVYAYLRPDDETAGRLAMAETMHKIIPDVYPACTREPSERENRR